MSKTTQGNNTTPGEPVPSPVSDCPLTKAVVVDFRTDCEKNQQPLALSEANVAAFQFQTAFATVCDDRRILLKSEDARSLYTNLYFNVALGLCKDTDEVQKCVTNQIKAAEDLGKKFAAAVGALKDLSAKVQAVQTEANKWCNLVGQSCNTASHDKINGILKDKFKDNIPVPTIKGSAAQLETDAIGAVNVADNVVEAAVKVSGVYSFSNIGSLKPYTDKLAAQSILFKADTEKNNKSAEDKIKAAQKSLSENLPKMSEAEILWRKECADNDGIDTIVNYLTPEDPKPSQTLDEVCAKVHKNLSPPVATGSSKS
jgi:hypothetical protein